MHKEAGSEYFIDESFICGHQSLGRKSATRGVAIQWNLTKS